MFLATHKSFRPLGAALSPLRDHHSRRGPWGAGEPLLADLLSDPIVLQLLKSDGLALSDVVPSIEAVQSRLRRGLCGVIDLAAA